MPHSARWVLLPLVLGSLAACGESRQGEGDATEAGRSAAAAPSEDSARVTGDVDAASTEKPGPDSLPRARPLTDRTFQVTPARLERGRYLAEGVLMCVLCHSERDWDSPGAPPVEGKEAAGAVLWERDGHRMVAPNLTPDSATGTGTWPDDALARAIREGVGHDGRALSLPMYWRSFRDLSDEDLASVIVYLRSLPPVRNTVPGRSLPPERVAELARQPMPLTEPVPMPDLSDPVARGTYLVRIADCAGCHTAWYSRPMPGVFGGGNEVGRADEEVYSSNISPDVSGIGEWGEEQFVRTMRSGKGGTLDPVMPWVAYRHMTDQDLAAVYRALRQAPPVRHWVNNLAPPTDCAVCGQAHGLGEHNEPIRIEPVDVPADVLADYVGRYVSEARGDTVRVMLEDGTLRLAFEEGESQALIPLSETRLRAAGLPAPLEFVRGQAGAVSHIRIRIGLEEEILIRQR